METNIDWEIEIVERNLEAELKVRERHEDILQEVRDSKLNSQKYEDLLNRYKIAKVLHENLIKKDVRPSEYIKAFLEIGLVPRIVFDEKKD
jgi:hypothetical protein